VSHHPAQFKTAIVAAYVFLALLSASGNAAAAEAWGDADRAALAHLREVSAGKDTFVVDFRDKQLQRIYRRQAERAGLSQERYPGFAKLLDDIAARHVRGKVDQPKLDEVSDEIIHLNLATQLLAVYPATQAGLDPTIQYLASAVASLQTSALPTFAATYASLCFYDQQNNPIGTCQVLTSFSNEAYIPVDNSLSTSLTAFTTVFQATYYDSSNHTSYPTMVTRSLDEIDEPLAQTIADPVILHQGNPETLVCVTRGQGAAANPGTCDYGTYQQTDIVIPVVGSETFAPSQNPQTNEQGQLVGVGTLSIVNQTAGGQCRFSPSISGSEFFAQPQVAYDASIKKLTWNFPSLDFGTAGGLICGNQGDGLTFSLQLSVNDSTTGNTISASQISQSGVTAPHYDGASKIVLLIPPLYAVNGCLAPDTKIAMADGTTVAIDTITGVDEQVLSAGGVKNAVQGVTRGTDATLYLIEAANDHKIRATAEHPFVLEGGEVRAAKALKAGDSVLTAKGPSALVSVKKTKYGGEIFNLVLAGTGDFNHTFYADGFLVGDNVMQAELMARERARPEVARADIPKQYRIDYDSALADRRLYRPKR